MKYLKIFMLLIAAVVVASCSDDDDKWNSTSEAVVSMGSAQISWKENKATNTPVYVPITVTGKRNGPVQVTVEVAESGDTPAMDDVHYRITSKTIVIPADADEGQIELMTVDDMDINENRTFTMTITDVKGGTLGDVASTLITLKDNDSEFYEKLMGGWKLSVYDATASADADPLEWNVSIDGFDEDEEGYNQTLYLTGFDGENEPVELVYEFDKTNNKGRVGLILPSDFIAAYNFSGIGPHFLGLCAYVPGSGWMNEESILWATWNEDFTEVTFENEDTTPLVGERLYVYPSGEATSYYYGMYQLIKLSR
jgi:hypothetical protein